MPDLPSGTVTFLISDVVGSTQRWATGNMAEALAIHDELTREVLVGVPVRAR